MINQPAGARKKKEEPLEKLKDHPSNLNQTWQNLIECLVPW